MATFPELPSKYKIHYPTPVDAILTQTFEQHYQQAVANGWCYKPGNCPGGIYYYPGVDLAKGGSVPLFAPFDGKVLETRKQATGYGWHIRFITDDGKVMFILAHMSRIDVEDGEQVKAGQVVGMMGNTGNSRGQHVHAEARYNGVPTNWWGNKYVGTTPPPPGPDPTPPPPDSDLDTSGFQKGIEAVAWVEVVVDILNVRRGPGVQQGQIGYLSKGDRIPVVAQRNVGKDLWIAFSASQWVAAIYENEDFVKNSDSPID